jgi:acylphosphatase
LLVSGRVQGVFFRDSVRRKANELGISGWVRNLQDGRVEVVFEGDEASVRDAIDYAREGPPFARVSEFHVSEEPATGDSGRFEIRH